MENPKEAGVENCKDISFRAWFVTGKVKILRLVGNM